MGQSLRRSYKIRILNEKNKKINPAWRALKSLFKSSSTETTRLLRKFSESHTTRSSYDSKKKVPSKYRIVETIRHTPVALSLIFLQCLRVTWTLLPEALLRERSFQRENCNRIESNRSVIQWHRTVSMLQYNGHDIIKIPAPPLKLIISNKRSNARETSAATRINVHTPLPVKL